MLVFKRNSDFRILVKSLFFILIFVVLLTAWTILLRPKWYRDGIWEPVTQIHDGFYSLEKNSTDVFFIGSSQVFADINPLLIWHDFGIASYDMTSSAQRLWISKYYVDEVIKYQKPEVIAFEVGVCFDDTPNDEDRNRKALDYMRLSPEKMDAISASIIGSPEESFLSYIFPIMRYHKRWSSLSAEDFRYFLSKKNFFLRGFSPRYNIETFSPERWKYNQNQGITIPPKNEAYLEEIISTCIDNQVELILFRSPTTRWSMDEHESIGSFAREKQLVFLDFNTLAEEIGLEDTDFNDWNHLNINGANKVSEYFGNYLDEHYDLRDCQTDMQWKLDYEKFETYDQENRIANAIPMG